MWYLSLFLLMAFATRATVCLTESEVNQDKDKCPRYCSIGYCNRHFNVSRDIELCEKAQKDCGCVRHNPEYQPPSRETRPSTSGNPAIYIPVSIALFVVVTIVNIFLRKIFCPNRSQHQCATTTCQPRGNSRTEVLSGPVTSTVASSHLNSTSYPPTFIVDSNTRNNNF